MTDAIQAYDVYVLYIQDYDDLMLLSAWDTPECAFAAAQRLCITGAPKWTESEERGRWEADHSAPSVYPPKFNYTLGNGLHGSLIIQRLPMEYPNHASGL